MVERQSRMDREASDPEDDGIVVQIGRATDEDV